MKRSFISRLLALAALCLVFSTVVPAQITRLQSGGDKPGITRPGPTSFAGKKNPSSFTKPAAATCDNDMTPPEVHCPAGNCQPTARAAYLTSVYYGEPWGHSDNHLAMDAVFGAGNWDAFGLENADASTLISPAYRVIFLEGSDAGGYALEAFLSANLPALESWVSAGGALFINCGPNYASPTINLGFGGVLLQSFDFSMDGIVLVPGHPVFNTPFAPANGNFSGNYFLHASISDPGGVSLIGNSTATGSGLSEKGWGAGKVFFGAMTMPYFHSPQPNAYNLRQNILANLNAVCDGSVAIPADAGLCTTIMADQSLDATATDDCALASLIHDFAAAPANTSLNGATFPAGRTLVQWTATDVAGNTGTCAFYVWVREPEAPAITCPENITVPAEPGGCGAPVNFAAATTDNCTLAPDVVTSPASGTVFPNGATTVIATATDASANTATCSFTVTVAPNPELCNGLDDDCNGLVDDGAPQDNTFYADADGDGYGDFNHPIQDCLPPVGYVDNALDCNDADWYIQPGMYESCNGIDDNCDGNIDEGVAPTWFADADGDGFGDPYTFKTACEQPVGYTYDNTDCDDTEAYIHPGAWEDCTNNADENCDGILGDNNFIIAETHTDVYCGSSPDGTISVTFSPAQNYPLIRWSTGECCTTTITNLQAGTYKVTVTNECGTTKVKAITILPSPTPTLQVVMSGTNSICGGAGNGTVTAAPQDGCGDYTYEWNTGHTQASLSGLSGGYYQVTVTDACGCTKSETFTIDEPYPVYLYFGAVIPLLDGTYFVFVVPNGGASPYTFRRSIPTGGFTNWSNSNGFAFLPAGTYTFEVRDNNGCTAQETITLDPIQPLVEYNPDGATPDLMAEKTDASETAARQSSVSNQSPEETPLSIRLFPNPNDGAFTLELSQPAPDGTAIFITDYNGRILRQLEASTGNTQEMIQANELPNGMYLLQVMHGGRVLAVEKFVKQE